jgi:pyruvate/2-oxoglutarate dehydrogenase complex dihydrolipoamide dehydrogenase (E3) component
VARPEFDIVVIGGGAGGLTVAAGGAALGAKVALVERHRLGGDCLWYGCVPSKTLLKSAHVAHQMRQAYRYALAPGDPRPDLAAVMERVADVIRGIEPNDSPERFRSLGVEVLFGEGRFCARDAFEVAGRRLTARTFVIATGSRPTVPSIPGLSGTPYLTNETLFDLRENVDSLIVVGGGPVGCELGQAMARLGSKVTIVEMGPRLLPREDPDLVAVVARQLVADGVTIHCDAVLTGVGGARGNLTATFVRANGAQQTLAGTHLLFASGRTPNLDGLDLAAAGVSVEHDRVVVDGKLRTTNPAIYAIGDVAGGLQLTHVAEHEAGVVLRHAIFRMRWARPSAVVPWCTFTSPELARVGLSETQAKQSGIAYRAYRFPFADIDRARAEDETAGFAQIITTPSGKLLGAAIVGPRAGELIAEYGLALAHGMKAQDISATIHAYPTFAQINRRVADQRMKEALTPGAKRWIRRLFGLRGAAP